MENEILQQILETQKLILNKVDALETDVKDVKQKVTKVEVILENVTNHNINLLVEGHQGVVEKLDDLKELSEKVINLQDDTQVHKAAIKDLYRKTAK